MSAGSLLLDLLWLECETHLVLLRATLLSCDKNGLLIYLTHCNPLLSQQI